MVGDTSVFALRHYLLDTGHSRMFKKRGQLGSTAEWFWVIKGQGMNCIRYTEKTLPARKSVRTKSPEGQNYPKIFSFRDYKSPGSLV